MSETQTNPQVYQIRDKLAFLESKLKEATPHISDLLREIHITLKKDPELVTILTEEECCILVAGLKKQTGAEIATSALKSGLKKSLKNVSVSDL